MAWDYSFFTAHQIILLEKYVNFARKEEVTDCNQEL